MSLWVSDCRESLGSRILDNIRFEFCPLLGCRILDDLCLEFCPPLGCRIIDGLGLEFCPPLWGTASCVRQAGVDVA
jgi:hypothetical protein